MLTAYEAGEFTTRGKEPEQEPSAIDWYLGLVAEDIAASTGEPVPGIVAIYGANPDTGTIDAEPKYTLTAYSLWNQDIAQCDWVGLSRCPYSGFMFITSIFGTSGCSMANWYCLEGPGSGSGEPSSWYCLEAPPLWYCLEAGGSGSGVTTDCYLLSLAELEDMLSGGFELISGGHATQIDCLLDCFGAGSGSGSTVDTVCCEGVLLPATIFATFSDVSEGCACLNEVAIPLTYSESVPELGGNDGWISETVELCGFGDPLVPWSGNLILECNDFENFVFATEPSNFFSSLTTGPQSCDPFSVSWTCTASNLALCDQGADPVAFVITFVG